MDYVVGSVAALISGNVTPNRPKVLKRALTPMKHQPSPNVTPKSESVTDRSIFLSPTMQKKKAIVKKSPKRIFENPELEVSSQSDGISSISSPKAKKVKKHLKDELDGNIGNTSLILSPKSPKNKSVMSYSKEHLDISADNPLPEKIQVGNESTPKKKKKKPSLVSESATKDKTTESDHYNNQDNNDLSKDKSIESYTPKGKRKFNTFSVETVDSSENQTAGLEKESTVQKLDKRKTKMKNKSNKPLKNNDHGSNSEVNPSSSVDKENEGQVKEKKKKKRKKNASKKVLENLVEQSETDSANLELALTVSEDDTNSINPNAITNQDTDSEHESDDDIQSDNEESNKAVLDTGPQETSDEEEEEEINKKEKAKKSDKAVVKEHVDTEEEVKRTLFVGNVLFSSKCKKDIKRIFGKYGEIETIRIRTVPVKDGRVTPKLAVIKNELHPDRSTVNVYIKYTHPSSINDALVENNTVLNDHHLRVSRSDVTGREHDPKCSVFVGNIPFALEDEVLRSKFEKCGEIESLRIVRDRKTHAGKGFGYVNFASKDGVELALALTEEDLTIKNRILRVKRCTQLTTNQQLRQQNNQRRQQNHQGRQQNHQGRQQNQGGQFNNRRITSNRDTQSNRLGRNQFDNDRFNRKNQNTDAKNEGAYRRIMNKRKPEENGEGPPQKRQKIVNQPNKEKKPRKEFVGMTADKKKFQKRILNKDQKKKKNLSEILTKQRQ